MALNSLSLLRAQLVDRQAFRQRQYTLVPSLPPRLDLQLPLRRRRLDLLPAQLVFLARPLEP